MRVRQVLKVPISTPELFPNLFGCRHGQPARATLTDIRGCFALYAPSFLQKG